MPRAAVARGGPRKELIRKGLHQESVFIPYLANTGSVVTINS